MSLLGSPIGEVALRSLDTKCALTHSRFSKRFVADMRAAPRIYRTALLHASKGFQVCRGCQLVRCCGKECQLAACPGHKAACEARAAEQEEKSRPTTVDL